MRILIISDAWHPQVNGVVRTYELIAHELKARGHIVHVIGPGDFPRTLPMPGYPEIRLALFPHARLEKMANDFRPDSIHVATEGPLGWAARRYCVKNNLPFSTSYHTQFPDYAAQRASRHAAFLYRPVHALAKNFIRLFHRPSSLVLVATPGLGNALRQWGFRNEMRVFSRGVDTAIFYPGTKKLFSGLPRPVALYVGRVAIEKNLPDFLGMEWAGSKVIVGEGPMLAELSRLYPRVHFAGKKTGADLAEHYRSADIFVFPSRTDTFGIVIVEALACGLPVAAYNVTGPKDIITDEALGALHEDDLLKAAMQALETGAAPERARHVKKHYTWEQSAIQFEEALANVMIPSHKDSHG